MANLKGIRIRLSSIISTKQITSAMKMVAASKLRRAQDAIIRLRPYANKLHEILLNISSNLDGTADSVFAKKREPHKILFILISSNRGLCGGFNSAVTKKATNLIGNEYKAQFDAGGVGFVTIGRKASEFVKKNKYNSVGNFDEIFNMLNFENVSSIAQSVMNYFSLGDFDKVIIIYNAFKNAAVQELTSEQFLPIEVESNSHKGKSVDMIFEPNREDIVEELIPKSLKIQFYKAILDSFAAEHSARMAAMHQATDNATELIKTLKLQYNKARQAAITNEILEIVGGAEAQKG